MRPILILRILPLALVLAAAGLTTGPFTKQAGAQGERTYVLLAGGWGSFQDAAVTRAGGTVTMSHGPTGIGIVTSGAPNFLQLALRSGAFSGGAEDRYVQWQPPEQFVLLEQSVTPGDETFINLQWNIQSIEAPGAWDAGFTGDGVRVAVLDGGIRSSHLDLDNNLDVAASASFVPGQPFNNDTGTFWHGTHVAGIIAAEDNGLGTIGIAPKATIIGVKVLHSGVGSFGQIIGGILYAATPLNGGGAGADIINMSLGAVFPIGGGNTGAGLLVAALNRAVNFASSKNVLVISAAGNEALNLDHSGSLISVPAQSGGGLAISATGPVGYAVGWPFGATNFRRPASYTNFGRSAISLAGPGGDFVLPGSDLCTIPFVPAGSGTTFCWVFDMVLSTIRGSGGSNTTYGFSAGTSMSAPAAAGVAALVKERFPGISVGALKNKLANTADDEGEVGLDPFYGRGFINARRAVTE